MVAIQNLSEILLIVIGLQNYNYKMQLLHGMLFWIPIMIIILQSTYF